MSETFSLFGIVFHWYGLIIGLSVLLGWRIAEWGVGFLYQGKQEQLEDLKQSFWCILVTGVVGARLYHVIDYLDYYRDHVAEVWQLWRGGLGIYGAILGGVMGLVAGSWIGAKVRWKERFWRVLDGIALGLPPAQAMGRIGNYVNKEVYGQPTDLLWSVFIPPEKRVAGYEGIGYYHPLFWYEAVWCLGGFLGLLVLVRKRLIQAGKGNYFVLYLAWYAAGRMWLETLRIRSWNWEGMPVTTIIGVVIIGGAGLFYLARKRRHEWTVLDH